MSRTNSCSRFIIIIRGRIRIRVRMLVRTRIIRCIMPPRRVSIIIIIVI